MSKENNPKQMSVFMIAKNKRTNLKLSRKFDSDLVALAVGWLLQEQAQRDENKPAIAKLEMRV